MRRFKVQIHFSQNGYWYIENAKDREREKRLLDMTGKKWKPSEPEVYEMVKAFEQNSGFDGENATDIIYLTVEEYEPKNYTPLI